MRRPPGHVQMDSSRSHVQSVVSSAKGNFLESTRAAAIPYCLKVSWTPLSNDSKGFLCLAGPGVFVSVWCFAETLSTLIGVTSVKQHICIGVGGILSSHDSLYLFQSSLCYCLVSFPLPQFSHSSSLCSCPLLVFPISPFHSNCVHYSPLSCSCGCCPLPVTVPFNFPDICGYSR